MSKINKELKKKWVRYILKSFDLGDILTWAEIRNRIKLWIKIDINKLEDDLKRTTDEKSKDEIVKEIEQLHTIDHATLSNNLKSLVNAGLLKYHGKDGYSYTKRQAINHYLKEIDKDAIDLSDIVLDQNIQFKKIDDVLRKKFDEKESIIEYNKKRQEIKKAAYIESRCLTVYGKKKNNDFLEKISGILQNTIKELHHMSIDEYREKFQKIVKEECKKIGNKNVKNRIGEWACDVVNKTEVLTPQRGFEKSNNVSFLLDPKKNDLSSAEYKQVVETAIKIVNKLEEQYPPLTIVMHF